MNYAKHTSTKSTPQTSPIPGSNQVPNSAGGYAWAVDDWGRLDRFLVLGSEGGSYYAGERELTLENAACVERLLKVDGPRVVARVAEISDAGRAPKNDPAIFALALALKRGDLATRRAAKDAVPKVCRIGTHIFQLAEAVKHLGGWGRLTHAAFCNWYLGQTPDALAMNLVKYQSRGGWSHKDLLAKVRPNPNDRKDAEAPITKALEVNRMLRWAVGKEGAEAKSPKVPYKLKNAEAAVLHPLISAFELAKTIAEGAAALKDLAELEDLPKRAPRDMAKLITERNLPRECVPTQFLNSTLVWDALLHAGKFGMPMTAMIRNLGKMSSIELIKPLSEAEKFVCDRLRDAQALKAARVHPMQVLLALKTYCDGKGDKGSLTWQVSTPVVEALNDAFYLACAAIEPTGKRHLLALDISGSMASGRVAGTSLTPRDASAAMALITARSEKRHEIVGFTCEAGRPQASVWGNRLSYGGGQNALKRIPIGPSTLLPTAVEAVSNMEMGGTDCALPMQYAQKNKLEVDAFVIFTDSETYAGTPHPMQALRDYRQASGIAARLITVGLVSNGFTIADPNDAGALDVCGFDSAVPALMADFIR